jgi:hypothetical protein
MGSIIHTFVSTMNTQTLRIHWFFLTAPLVFAVDLYFGLSLRGEIDRLLEAGLLLDLVVLIPFLYWLCYRQRGRKAVIRAAAIACLGAWVASKVVPEPQWDLLNYVVPLRYIGLAVLVWLEVVVFVAIYRTIFKGGSIDEATSQAPADIPRWAAKLLALEASFWLKAWGAVKRMLGKR